MEAAFASRAARLAAMSDHDISNFDPSGTEASYQRVLQGMSSVCGGVEVLKDAGTIARVYERYMWAAWLRQQLTSNQAEMRRSVNAARARRGRPPVRDVDRRDAGLDIGTDVEARLMAVGIGAAAGVVLTGHWYSSNSPANWMALLGQWADGYSESIAV